MSKPIGESSLQFHFNRLEIPVVIEDLKGAPRASCVLCTVIDHIQIEELERLQELCKGVTVGELIVLRRFLSECSSADDLIYPLFENAAGFISLIDEQGFQHG